jgi:FkbM family methyltransferase
MLIMEARYFGEHKDEANEISRLPSIIGDCRSFLDIGSSLGQYAYYAGQYMTSSNIYLVEPDPLKVEALRDKLNEWARQTGNRYYLLECALSDKTENLDLYVPSDHLSSAALFPVSDQSYDRVTVSATTLDDLFEPGAIEFIKLDVEGAEYRVLSGARRLMTMSNVRLLLEIAPWGDRQNGTRPSQVVKLLGRYGYTFRVYESHYLFEKRGNRLSRGVRNIPLAMILDNERIKRHAKRINRLMKLARSLLRRRLAHP